MDHGRIGADNETRGWPAQQAGRVFQTLLTRVV
jgi:hypothetical protein